MASNHIYRINEDIQRCLSSLLRQVKDPRVQQGDLLSIVRVDTTGDLRWSTVYLSVLGQVDEKEFRKGLKSCSGWLRRELGHALQLRYTPELVWELDDSITYGAKMLKLINSLEVTQDGDADES